MNKKILIVDDEQDQAQAYALNLENCGYEARYVLSGPEALDMLRKTPDFDCIVLDARMPGMDGFEVLEKIAKAYPAMPVLFFTGVYTSPDDAVRATKLGASDFMIKQAAHADLLELRIEKAIAVKERAMIVENLARGVAHAMVPRLSSAVDSLTLAKGTKSSVEVKKYIDKAIKNIRYSGILLDRFLKYPDLDKPGEAHNVRELMERAVEDIRDYGELVLGPKNSPAIQLLDGKNNLKVKCDPYWLTECFYILLQNAIDATMDATPPRIQARLREHNGDARIEVSDNGRGLPPELGDDIYRLGVSTKRSARERVHGIGLFFARRVVGALNGKISHKPCEDPAMTTTFMIEIPTANRNHDG